MSKRQCIMHFDAEVDEEASTMGLGIRWEADLTDSVAVMIEASRRNPQIRAVIDLASGFLKEENPMSLHEVIAAALSANAGSKVDVSAEELAAMAAKFKSQSNKKGDA